MDVLAQIRALLDDDEGVELGWMSDDEVREHSRGSVSKPWTINERTGKPERGGLHCARIFGTVDELGCLCGKYQGTSELGTTCEKCGVIVDHADSARTTRFGHIELGTEMAHPWSGATITCLPVLPASTREILPERLGKKLVGVNALYAELVKRNIMVARCLDKAAPTLVIDHERSLLQDALDALFGQIPQRPGRGDKLGQRLRRALAEHTDIVALQRVLQAAGIRFADRSES